MRSPSPTRSPQTKESPLPRTQTSPRTPTSALPPSPVRRPAQVFPTLPRSRSPTKENNIVRTKDMWVERAPVAVKPLNGGHRGTSPGPAPRVHGSPKLVGKRVLPGMVVAPQPQPQLARPESPTKSSNSKPSTPKPVSPISPRSAPPASPGRHTRTPSTGNRATVMEVAQTMLEKQDELSPVALDESPISKPRLSPGSPSPHTNSAMARERRRSSYERYSAIMMPPLREEKTPVPTPAGTLSRSQELNVPTPAPAPAKASPKMSPKMSPKPSPKMSPQPSPKMSPPQPSPKVQPAPLPAEIKPKQNNEVFKVGTLIGCTAFSSA